MLIINDLYTISLQLDIVSKTSWACVVSWLILFLISFFRIIFVIDFHLYKICVFQIEEVGQNKKEEVLKITNYEEQRRIRFDNESNALINLEEKTAEEKIMDESKPVQPNAAFYVITDIRLLRREQQRKKSFKLFDQAFEKNKVSISVKSYKNFILPDANIFPIPSLSCCCFRSLDKFCSRKFKESCFNTQIRIDIVCYYTKI